MLLLFPFRKFIKTTDKILRQILKWNEIMIRLHNFAVFCCWLLSLLDVYDTVNNRVVFYLCVCASSLPVRMRK